MKFCDVLNNYIEELNCLAKDIEKHSGISASTLSRYRSGERIPDRSSDNYRKLCRAIEEIAASKGIEYTDIDQKFAECFESTSSPDCNVLRENFNTLITALDISIGKLCKSLNYDTSTVFRIRNGTRQPSDPTGFAKATAAYIAETMSDNKTALSALSELIGTPLPELDGKDEISSAVFGWLISAHNDNSNSVADFLKKIDDFDLNLYIKTIHFDDIKIPTVPFHLPTSKYYYGLSEMMQSELDFLKATVLSRSNEPVIMYSDMPMKEMADDPEFPKKWMFGMALMLKKGLHLCQIHNLDRSLEDMMLGLESWIPMYMTGQIAPYYLKNVQNNAFLHLLKVSGAAALSGEAVAGFHSEGRYYLTKSKKELGYYRKRANDLLSNACPLMEIYRSDREKDFSDFLTADSRRRGVRRSILSALPVYTMDNDLLNSILDRNGIDDRRGRDIKAYVSERKKRVESILETMTIDDEICCLSREEFETRPHALDLSGVFCASDVLYSYDDYSAHLKSTECYAQTHENYSLKYAKRQTFCNLQILIHEGQWAMISKGNAPAIHFVIRHPKLLSALENFIPPVIEDQ